MGIPVGFVRVYVRYHLGIDTNRGKPAFRQTLQQLIESSRYVVSEHFRDGRYYRSKNR